MKIIQSNEKHSISFYLSLATLVLLLGTIFFTISKAMTEQRLQSNAANTTNPSFYPLAPCPTCTDPSEPPSENDSTVPSSTVVNPSEIMTNPSPISAPCEASEASLAHDRKSKHWNHDGGASGFMEQLMKFFMELINMILKLFGFDPIELPDGTNPNQPEEPDEQEPDGNNPDGENPDNTPNPEPCVPSEEPAIPSENPAQPSTGTPSTAVPSTGVNPSGVVPSQIPGTNDPTAATCATATSPLAGYTLTKCEDFNGTDTGAFDGYEGGGDSTVVGGGRKKSQCTAAGGMLTLTQTSDGSTCGGSMNDFAQKYGYWEVKMKTYSTGSGGSAPHPVLILWPDNNVWADGELDYFESDLGDDSMGVFLHCIGNPSSNCYSTQYKVDVAQWHVYGFEWTAAGFKGYVDGKEIYSTDGKGSNPSVSMHQTIQLDNLSGRTPVSPGKMDIDWVHMYKKN